MEEDRKKRYSLFNGFFKPKATTTPTTLTTTKKKSSPKASNKTTRKKRGDMDLHVGQMVIYREEEVELIGIEGDLCTILLKKRINNDSTQMPDEDLGIEPKNSEVKKSVKVDRERANRLDLSILKFNNLNNEIAIKDLLIKMFGKGQEPVNIRGTYEFARREKEMLLQRKYYLENRRPNIDKEEDKELEDILLDEKAEHLKNRFIRMSFERQKQLVDLLFSEKKMDEKISKSFYIEDNYWKYKYITDFYNTNNLVDKCDDNPCPELFSNLTRSENDFNDVFFGKQIKNHTVLREGNTKNTKDSFDLNICIRVPKKDLNPHIFRTYCSELRFSGSSFINAVLNSFVMALPMRELLYDYFEKNEKKDFLTQTQLEEPPPSIESYSKDTVHKHFISLVHLLQKGKIQSPVSLVETLSLQIKHNYLSIMSEYRFKDNTILYDVSKPLSDPSTDDLVLVLLEILKSNDFIDYFINDFSLSNYKNWIDIANGKDKIINELHRPRTQRNPVPFVSIVLHDIPSKIHYEKDINNDKIVYNFQSCVINLKIIRDDNSIMDYPLTCYVCNNKEYIYDPNNYIDQINFIGNNKNNNYTIIESNIRRLIMNRLAIPNQNIMSVDFIYSIYINSDYAKKIGIIYDDKKMKEEKSVKEQLKRQNDEAQIIRDTIEFYKIDGNLMLENIKRELFINLYDSYFFNEKNHEVNQEFLMFRQSIIDAGRIAIGQKGKLELIEVVKNTVKKQRLVILEEKEERRLRKEEEKKELEEKLEEERKINFEILKDNNIKLTDIYKRKIQKTDLILSSEKITHDGWKLLKIPAGTMFFRGLHELNSIDHRDLPDYKGKYGNFIYFGDFDTAAHYAHRRMKSVLGEGRIVCVKSKKDMHFFDFSEISNFDKIYKLAGNNSNIQLLFLKCFNYIDEKSTLDRTSRTQTDYPLTEWLCKLLPTHIPNLPVQGFGYNQIKGFHMEYIVCRGNISEYMEPSNLEYWYFNFYEKAGGSSIIFESETNINSSGVINNILTNNIIYTKDSYFIHRDIINDNTNRGLGVDDYYVNKMTLGNLAWGWETILLQDPIYDYLKLYCYKNISHEEKRIKVLIELKKARRSFLKYHKTGSIIIASPNNKTRKSKELLKFPMTTIQKNLTASTGENFFRIFDEYSDFKEEIKHEYFKKPFEHGQDRRAVLKSNVYKEIILDYGIHGKAVLKLNIGPNERTMVYDAYVGLFLNKLNIQFPFFIDTYGCMKNPRVGVIDKGDGIFIYPKIDKSYLAMMERDDPYTYEHLKPYINFKDSIIPDQYSVFYEFVMGKNLNDIKKSLLPEDKIIILFQIYSVLEYLDGNFVHGMLNCENVIISPLVEYPENEVFEFVYHYPDEKIIRFYSSFTVKIKNFSNSHFHDKEKEVDEKSESNIPQRNRSLYTDLLLFLELCEDMYIKSEWVSIEQNIIDIFTKQERLKNIKTIKIDELNEEIKDDEKEKIINVFKFLNGKIKEVQKNGTGKTVKGTDKTVKGRIEFWMDGSNKEAKFTKIKTGLISNLFTSFVKNNTIVPTEDDNNMFPLGSKMDGLFSSIIKKEEESKKTESPSKKTESPSIEQKAPIVSLKNI